MDDATEKLIAAIVALAAAVAGYLLRPKGDKLVAQVKARRAASKPPSQPPAA